MRQVGALLLGQRGGGHDHAGGAEAALIRLRIEEALLHRVQHPLLAKPLDRGDILAARAEGRYQAGVHRFAVEPDGAGAAIPGIAALFDTERPLLAQPGAQALARARLRADRPPVDDAGRTIECIVHAAALSSSARISAAR